LAIPLYDLIINVVDANTDTAENPLDVSNGRLVALLGIPDTDGDHKDDFQDIDSDNDGSSDLIEGGTLGMNDSDRDGMIDSDVDANGIPTITTPIATPLDSNSNGLPNYREVPVVIVPYIPTETPEPVEEPKIPLVEGEDTLKTDQVVVDLSQPVTINILENDRDGLDSSTVEIELPEGFKEKHPNAELSEDKKRLDVPNEGTWLVNSDGTITYAAEFENVDPSPISYSVETIDGKRLKTDTRIVLKQSVVEDAIKTCEDYEEKVSIYSNGAILIVILLGSLFGVFLFRKEK